jgi:hypothetical protein
MSKNRVDLEEFFRVMEYLDEINNTKLTDIDWYSNGGPVPIPPKIMQEWEFTGLNNTWFGESIFKFNDKSKTYEVDLEELKK